MFIEAVNDWFLTFFPPEDDELICILGADLQFEVQNIWLLACLYSASVICSHYHGKETTWHKLTPVHIFDCALPVSAK